MAEASTMTVQKSRRSFLWSMALAGAALFHSGGVPGRGWVRAAEASAPDLVRDTFNGLLAFVVPGPDSYSVAQGVSTPEPGGVEAGATDALIAIRSPCVLRQIVNRPPEVVGTFFRDRPNGQPQRMTGETS